MAKKNKLDRIRSRAIDLVADAIEDDEIPAAKRAAMALDLLGKQAIKSAQDEPESFREPVEIIFHIVDDRRNNEELCAAAHEQPEGVARQGDDSRPL